MRTPYAGTGGTPPEFRVPEVLSGRPTQGSTGGGENGIVPKVLMALTTFLAATVLVACAEDEATPVALAVTQASDGELTVSGPDTVEAGAVEIRFQNQARGPADAELIEVEGNRTADEVLEVLDSNGGPIPSWFKAAGGVGRTPPGQTATATVELDEGSYYVVSEVEVVDEDDEGSPPATKSLRVSGDGGGNLPGADATISAEDYRFEVGGLQAGRNEVRFENKGREIHHVVAAPIARGSSFDDVRAFFQTEGETAGPPPVDFTGSVGTAVIDPGKALVTTLELKAGKYAFVCFIQDRAGGPPHFAKGMLQEVTVSA